MENQDNPSTPKSRTRKTSVAKRGKNYKYADSDNPRKPKNSNKSKVGDKELVGGVKVNSGSKPELTATGKEKLISGRPDKRTDPELVADMLNFINAGNPYKVVCGMVEIDESTFYRWMKEGADAPDGSLAREFYQRVKKASAQACHRNMMRIQKGVGSWQSSAWFLERRMPEEFALAQKVNIGGQAGNPIQSEVTAKVIEDDGAVAALKSLLSRKPDLLSGR